MYIEDAVHALVDHIVYHLFDAIHPCGVHLAVAIHLLIPGHGHTDGTESCLFHHLQELRLCNGLSPAGLMLSRGRPGLRSVFCIKGVAKIPAHAHVLHGIFGRLEISGLCIRTHHQATQ